MIPAWISGFREAPAPAVSSVPDEAVSVFSFCGDRAKTACLPLLYCSRFGNSCISVSLGIDSLFLPQYKTGIRIIVYNTPSRTSYTEIVSPVKYMITVTRR